MRRMTKARIAAAIFAVVTVGASVIGTASPAGADELCTRANLRRVPVVETIDRTVCLPVV